MFHFIVFLELTKLSKVNKLVFLFWFVIPRVLSLALHASPEGMVSDWGQLENSSASISPVHIQTQPTLEESVVLGFLPFSSREASSRAGQSGAALCSGRAHHVQTLDVLYDCLPLNRDPALGPPLSPICTT